MSKKGKFILISFITACIVGFGVYYYIMHSGGRDLTTEETDFSVSSNAIISEFTTDVAAANAKYLEKAVSVKGTVIQVDGNLVMLDNAVSCSFKEIDPSIKIGDMVTVKGRLVGYDDLMEELKLDQCFKE